MPGIEQLAWQTNADRQVVTTTSTSHDAAECLRRPERPAAGATLDSIEKVGDNTAAQEEISTLLNKL